RVERLVEDHIIDLLREGAGLAPLSLPQPLSAKAPPGYLPMMPVPLWPDALVREESAPRTEEDRPAAGGDRQAATTGRQIAMREKSDGREKDRSPFILNRFEKILAMAEMVNVDR